MNLSKKYFIVLILASLATVFVVQPQLRRGCIVPLVQRIKGKKTVSDRLEQYGESVQRRLAGDFDRIDINYPAQKMVFVGLKEERKLEVWVSEKGKPYSLLKTYPILGASGELGPKLQQGDMQVPEGLYKIESLNPNSMFHLSLRVNYPNAFDRKQAEGSDRKDLGGDIMIHGNTCSVGCLAMGDSAAEELFIMAALTGLDNISVILSPIDFRKKHFSTDVQNHPHWVNELYSNIQDELLKLASAQ